MGLGPGDNLDGRLSLRVMVTTTGSGSPAPSIIGGQVKTQKLVASLADLGGCDTVTRRGLRGVKLVISDSHEGLKAAAAKTLGAVWQRCRVHFMRNALSHVTDKDKRPMVAAMIRTVFAEHSAEAARDQWRKVADGLRPKFRKLAELMDAAEPDVLAYMSFPKAHWTKLHSTNPIERLNGEVKRRTDVVGIFPNEAAILRLVGAILLEQTDEWVIQRRYMTLETIAPLSDDPTVTPALAAA